MGGRGLKIAQISGRNLWTAPRGFFYYIRSGLLSTWISSISVDCYYKFIQKSNEYTQFFISYIAFSSLQEA